MRRQVFELGIKGIRMFGLGILENKSAFPLSIIRRSKWYVSGVKLLVTVVISGMISVSLIAVSVVVVRMVTSAFCVVEGSGSPPPFTAMHNCRFFGLENLF